MPKAYADGEKRWPPSGTRLRAYRPRDTLWWYDYADLWLDGSLGCVLDFGCAAGEYLERLADRAGERHGVDIDPEQIAQAAARPDVRVQTLRPADPLPYPDGTFDTAFILEVIEHVADERRTLRDLARVLKPGGYLLLTTPHKGWLTFLDPGNFKCLLPGVHRFIHTRLLGRRDYYERRFGEDRRTRLGMYGDLHGGRTPWHRHYTYHELRRLAPPELETVAWRAYYPGFRALSSLQLAIKVLTGGRIRHLPAPLAGLRARLSHVESRGGDQLVILFRRARVGAARSDGR